MRAAINNTLVKNLLREPPAKDVDIRDTKLTGFILRCRASGNHSYAVEYGRGKRLKLGSIHELKPAEAREEAMKVLGDAKRGIDPLARKREAKAHTWGSFLTEVYAPWLTDKGTRRIGENIDRVREQFKDLERLKLKDISRWHIEKWRSARQKAGIKPATINRDMAPLKSALSKAVEWEYIDTHPLAKLKPLKTDNRPKVRYLSADEHTRLIEALARRDTRIKAERKRANEWRRARGYKKMRDLSAFRFADHLEPMILLSLNTGLRRGELFSLKWDNVNLPGRMLTVIGETSKSKQTRHVPLNDVAFGALVAWRNQTGGEGLVFPSEHGRAFGNCNTAWRHLLRDAGITAFRWHDMRHDFASKLVTAGVNLYVVKALLGHHSIEMTERYAHLAPDHKSEAVARLCGV